MSRTLPVKQACSWQHFSSDPILVPRMGEARLALLKKGSGDQTALAP